MTENTVEISFVIWHDPLITSITVFQVVELGEWYGDPDYSATIWMNWKKKWMKKV